MRVLGIDPGATGALAFLTLDAGLSSGLELVDMPTAKVAGRSHLDAYALAREIDARLIVDGEPLALAIIEQGQTRPHDGRAASATFWLGIGVIRGVLAANFVPMEFVAASAWKRAIRLTGDKDASRLRASAAFPRFASLWARAKDHGRAEAALIALYGANLTPGQVARSIA